MDNLPCRLATPALLPLVEAFLGQLDRSARTVGTYSSALRKFSAWMAGRTETFETAVLAYKQERLAARSASTVAVDIAALRAFGAFLVRQGQIERNPADDIRAPKQSKLHRRDALTLTGAVRLLDGIDTTTFLGKRDFAILSLMVRAGLRDVEISRADIGDLRPLSGQCALRPRQRARRGG
jgi:site-specific recombinase XerC